MTFRRSWPGRSTILTAVQAAAVAAAYARLTAELDPYPAQPLHGDAGAGNLMAAGDGWVWHDFEDTCSGPVAWDLAASTASQRLDGSRILAAYGAPVDPAQLEVCQQLRRLHLSVWYALYAERLPHAALPDRRTPGYVAGALTERGRHTTPRRLVSGQ